MYADEETGDIPAKEKEEVSVAGIIRSYKVIYTKNNEPMVFLDVEDSIGVTKVVVFHSLYELINEKIREDRPVFIRGKVSNRKEYLLRSAAGDLLKSQPHVPHRDLLLRVNGVSG